ncbi:uncharacterized protein clmnb [Cololabis saira]|uniref:uncharacterized protein clmnb n=1 Tax=Cololabis saira TaxID=129043 RepID=UPI002AD2F95C|nr:uncharacterized protein clmnb [Cololabis saira]
MGERGSVVPRGVVFQRAGARRAASLCLYKTLILPENLRAAPIVDIFNSSSVFSVVRWIATTDLRMQDDWDSQGRAAGVIGDQHGQDPGGKEAVQKRTFTRWMNVFLKRCDPPLEVQDLFTDVQGGRVLMALLEELSGCKLLYRFRSSSHRIFRLNNISKALAFLDDRHVKLLGIDACGIADGVPSVVLSLIWNIILHFQVEEVTEGLQRLLSSTPSSSSLSSYPSASDLSLLPHDDGDGVSCSTLPRKRRNAARQQKYRSKAVGTLLQWVQRRTAKYGVNVYDFGKSWRSGLAFLAMIKAVEPDLVDLRESFSREPKENVRQAFMVAQHSLDVPPLLEPEDVTCSSPDEQSIITYVSTLLGRHSGIEDHVTNSEVPEIPNFGSVESVALGETLAGDPEVQALLKSFEKSSEQILWRQWSRRSSGTSAPSSAPPRVLQPSSPLDVTVASQDIRAWMGKGLAWGNGEQRSDKGHVSLSSEDGVCSLSALDSDEEDAYSYILDLNTGGFQSFNHSEREVPTVEEETAEEMRDESQHLEAHKTFNGCGSKHRRGSAGQDPDFNQQPYKNKSNRRETTDHRDVPDSEPEAERGRKEACEEERDDDGGCRDGEREKKRKTATWVKDGCDNTEADEEDAEVFEAARRQRNVEGEEGRELSGKWGCEDERRRRLDGCVRSEEEEGLRYQTEMGDICLRKGEMNGRTSVNSDSFKVKVRDEVRNTDAARTETVEGSDSADEMEESVHFRPLRAAGGEKPENTKPKDLTSSTAVRRNDIHDGDSGQTGAQTSQSPRNEGRLFLRSLAASCDITPLELEMLLVLWILLYCYFILFPTSL